MAEEIKQNQYICKACGYSYVTKELAERCEEWCTKHHSCNLDITSQGTPPKENT